MSLLLLSSETLAKNGRLYIIKIFIFCVVVVVVLVLICNVSVDLESHN